MKQFPLWVIVLLLATNLHAQNLKRYADKSGVIESVVEGSSTGKQIVKWDDFGAKEYMYSETEMTVFGMKTSDKSHTLRIGLEVYNWKDGETTGTVTQDEFLAEMAKTDDWETYSKNVMQKLGYQKQGNTTVLGKNCDLWVGNLGTIATYKSYGMKSDTKVMGVNVKITATRYGAGEAIPASAFQIPQNIKFQTVDQQLPEDASEEDKEQVKETKEMLKGFLKGLGN